ncbi:MAG: phospho-sugar mutase [Dysgonamonadaceae bacterium]|jgi:phosphoglucomutase|nr:phospho-sugar mutase [Dysgonamonadaceae bacterium]
MADEILLQRVRNRAEKWLSEDYDDETRSRVQTLLDSEDLAEELADAFYRNLDFGTGGLRGVMGVGSNRMNRYTVGIATQGLVNYLLKEFSSLSEISVVVGYDCRNNSVMFAEAVADIFSANGIKTFLFSDLRPTPEVSYAVRCLGCQAGVMITASHNPKEYNGYKVYWNDGAQVVAPHDRNIFAEMNNISSIGDVNFCGKPELIYFLDEEMDDRYIGDLLALSLSPDAIERRRDIKIVYTPIHGTGVTLIPRALSALGFTNVIHVPEQDVVSGDFPTVALPNPEEAAAFEMAIKRAVETDADIVLASDPDADRVGLAVKDDDGRFVLLNGNQTLLIYLYYLIVRRKELGLLKGGEYVVKTIVSTELVKAIADRHKVKLYNCYTGFKWIAAIIREKEDKETYIGGGEESYGFLVEDFVRDKDAVSGCMLLSEIAAWAADGGRTLYRLLQDIYVEYGFSKEWGVSVIKEGRSGAEEIESMMKNYRLNGISELAGSKVVLVYDFKKLTAFDLIENETFTLDMPTTSNVLQYFSEDGTKVSVRPSGTEPKIKFYVEVRGRVDSREGLAAAELAAEKKFEAVKKSLGI